MRSVPAPIAYRNKTKLNETRTKLVTKLVGRNGEINETCTFFNSKRLPVCCFVLFLTSFVIFPVPANEFRYKFRHEFRTSFDEFRFWYYEHLFFKQCVSIQGVSEEKFCSSSSYFLRLGHV